MNMRKNAKNNFINNCENGPLKNYYKTILNWFMHKIGGASSGGKGKQRTETIVECK